jgi:putative PIN family toxin of toxin-antitoxin system
MSHIVIDTNVMVAGLRSRRGSAFRLLTLVGTRQFAIHLSVPLVLEYEEVLLRELPHLQVPRTVVEDGLDFHCTVAVRHQIFFLWRPYLPDPSDDMLLELAVAAQCHFIVTYNIRDFVSIERFALQAVEPGAFYDTSEHFHEYHLCASPRLTPATVTCLGRARRHLH